MVSLASNDMLNLANDWDWRDPVLVAEYPSAVFSGIVPDSDHLDTGGYHVSIEDLVLHGNGGDYSNSRPLDIAPPVTTKGKQLSCAMDMSMSPTDMAKHYKRVKVVYDDRSDPRRKYFSYVNTWDGVSASATRFDFQGNRILTASADHKWHAHQDYPRAYVDFYRDSAMASKAMRAYRSMLIGESKAAWTAREEKRSDDKMMFTAKIGSTNYLCWNTEYDVVAFEMTTTQATAYGKLGLPTVGTITSLNDIGATPMGDFRDDYFERMKDAMMAALQEAGLQVEIGDLPPFEISLTSTGSATPITE